MDIGSLQDADSRWSAVRPALPRCKTYVPIARPGSNSGEISISLRHFGG